MSQLIDSVVGGILDSRAKSLPGYSYKLQENGGYGLDAHVGSLGEVNESEMSVVFPFADGKSRDGGGDLLDIGGIDVSRHVRNPLVMVDHGKTVPFPVGRAENPDTGEYTIKLDPVGQVATCKAFFYRGGKDYDHSVFCEQLFDLVRQKFIRSGSIGYQIKYAEPIPPDYRTGTPQGLHLKSVLLLEASIVVMPMNAMTVMKSMPDVREILCKGSVCGKPLSPYLVKSLAPYAEAKAAVVGGYGGKARVDLDAISKLPEAEQEARLNQIEPKPHPAATGPEWGDETRNYQRVDQVGNSRIVRYTQDPPSPEQSNAVRSEWRDRQDAVSNARVRIQRENPTAFPPRQVNDPGGPAGEAEKALLSRKRRAAEILDDEQMLEQFERWHADNSKEGDKVTEAASGRSVPASVRKLTAEGPDVRGKANRQDDERAERHAAGKPLRGEVSSRPYGSYRVTVDDTEIDRWERTRDNPRPENMLPDHLREGTEAQRNYKEPTPPKPTAPAESKVPELTASERARVNAGEAQRRASEAETARRYEDASRKKSVQVPRVTPTRIPPSEWRPGVGAVKKIDDELVKSIRQRVKASSQAEMDAHDRYRILHDVDNSETAAPDKLHAAYSQADKDDTEREHDRRREQNTEQKRVKSIKDKYRGAKSQPGHSGPGSEVAITEHGGGPVGNTPQTVRGRVQSADPGTGDVHVDTPRGGRFRYAEEVSEVAPPPRRRSKGINDAAEFHRRAAVTGNASAAPETAETGSRAGYNKDDIPSPNENALEFINYQENRAGQTGQNSLKAKGQKNMPNVHAPDFDRDGSGAIDTPQEHAAVEKYSLTCLRQMHEDARILLQEYYEMSQPLDHEGVGRVMQRELEDLVTKLEMLEAIAEKYHPGSTLDGGEDVPPEEAPVDGGPADVPPEGDVPPEAVDAPPEAVDAPPPDPNAAVDEFDYAEDLDDAERAVEEDTDVVAQGNTDAVQADSSAEPPPTEDEVVEGMRKAGPVRAGVKDLRKQFTKGCKMCGYKMCKCVKAKRMKPKGKPVVGKKGAKAYGDPMNNDPLAPPTPRAAATPTAPIMRGDMIQVKGMGGDGSLLDHELHHVREAHGFLGELVDPSAVSTFGEEHRMKSYHFSKMLDCIGNIGVKGDDRTVPSGPGTRMKRRRLGATTGVPGGTEDAVPLPDDLTEEEERGLRLENLRHDAYAAGGHLPTSASQVDWIGEGFAEQRLDNDDYNPKHPTSPAQDKLKLRRRRGADYGGGVTIGDKELDDQFHKAGDDERAIEDAKKRDRDNDDVEIDLAQDPETYGEGSLHPHREACRNASVFFKALSNEKAFGAPHQKAAAYHHSILGEVVSLPDVMPDPEPIQEDIEENEVVENVEGPGWEPGEMDEKALQESLNNYKILEELNRRLASLTA